MSIEGKYNKVLTQQWYVRYKMTHGCAICGYNTCAAALEFHHTDPNTKESNLNTLVKSGCINRLKREIKKCILLCANCHRETHAWEREGEV